MNKQDPHDIQTFRTIEEAQKAGYFPLSPAERQEVEPMNREQRRQWLSGRKGPRNA